jgi:hypothetical protein
VVNYSNQSLNWEVRVDPKNATLFEQRNIIFTREFVGSKRPNMWQFGSKSSVEPKRQLRYATVLENLVWIALINSGTFECVRNAFVLQTLILVSPSCFFLRLGVIDLRAFTIVYDNLWISAQGQARYIMHALVW